MSKKTLAKTLGASTLAVATIISGLSFGSAASASSGGDSRTQPGAVDSSTNAGSDGGARWGHFYMSPSGESNYAVNADLSVTRTSDKTAGAIFSFPEELYAPGPIRLAGSDQCMARPSGGDVILAPCDSGSSAQKWSLYGDGTIHLGTSATRLVTRATQTRLSTSLSAGDKLDVSLLSAFSATAEFDEDVSKKATITGFAPAGFTIDVLRNGKVVGSGRAGADNSFSVEVDAPNAGGDSVVQVHASDDSGSGPNDKDVTLAYGNAVSITAPGDGSEHVGGPITVRGGGVDGGKVTLTIDGTVVDTTTVANSEYSFTTDLPNEEHRIEVTQVGKGNNTTSSSVTIKPGEPVIAEPTGQVSFDQDVTQRATVSGTVAEGATIKLFTGDDEIGSATVENGTWTTTIRPLGTGKHTIRIEQTGIKGTQTAETEADYGDAVSLTGPTEFTNGELAVTGKSSAGATVTITSGGKTLDTFTVTNADGTFSRSLTGVGSGKVTLTATADSRGGVSTTADHTATAPIIAEDIAMSSHIKNGTFLPGAQTFTGRGTVGATVTLNPFGFDSKYENLNLTTTVDQFGEWSIQRGLSDTPYPLFAFKQTPQTGVTNEVLNYNLKPFKQVGEPGDLQLTTFKAGDFFNPGDQTFSGLATPGAEVIMNPFGFDPQYARYDISTFADSTTGEWSIRRGLAAGTIYRELGVRQVPETEGKVNKIERITVAANDWIGTPANLVLTSHTDPTFTPGTEQTFTGTATPGTIVTLYPFGTAYPGHAMTTKTDATGKWTIVRTLGNQVFPIHITQEEQAGKTNTIDLKLTPAN